MISNIILLSKKLIIDIMKVHYFNQKKTKNIVQIILIKLHNFYMNYKMIK